MQDFKGIVAFHGLSVAGTALGVCINKHDLKIPSFQTGGNVDRRSGFSDSPLLVNKTDNHLGPPF
jgi:hypothetical protein